ncbi:MAG: H-type small acid-soluble spore protein [Clostridiales bacterium]|nr:H-type small acid-soluble spore protein [Clostridiales bacterium]MCF8022028.1 H-type small acid-soluble spore protein [Clostridiales bacterium]
MKFERAQQIINSDKNIEVFYQERPVWIESLISDNETAVVKPLHGIGSVQEVQVDNLVEEG